MAAQLIVSELKAYAARIDELQDELSQRIADARSYGLSWEVIGWSLSISADSARHRWGPSQVSR